MNPAGKNLTAPEAFRASMEIILDSGWTKCDTLMRLAHLDTECQIEFNRARSKRNFWFRDYWRGNRRRISKALKLVLAWPDVLPVRIRISSIYGRPTLVPVDKVAARQIKRTGVC